MKHFILCAMLVMASGVWAQTPVADGILGNTEYARTETKSGITVAASLSPDGKTIYLAMKAKTAGWVGIGAGSQKMDKSFMALAYVAGDIQTIVEETGKGKSHSTNPGKLLISSFASESDGTTTLEVSLPAQGFITDKALDLIAAYGAQDNRTSMHRGKGSFRFTF